MKIIITDKKKKDIFISIFQILKNSSSTINATFETNHLHIQGIDKSHICLFNLKIMKEWFDLYEVKNAFKLAFDSNIFFSIISTKSEDLNMLIEYDLEKNPDTIHIQFVQLVSNHLVSKDQVKTKSKPSKVKGEFNKYFKMPLMEYDYQELEIHNIEYDAEFSLSSKQISEMCSQLNNFGDDIIIHCSQDDIDLISNGTLGEMRVNMSIDDLNSYSIVEDMNIKLTYSLTYINKMCITPKISNDVQFSLNENTPMKILYNLGDDSIMSFFIAPKVNDEN